MIHIVSLLPNINRDCILPTKQITPYKKSALSNWYSQFQRCERGNIIDRLALALDCERNTSRAYLSGARRIQGHQIRRVSDFTNGAVTQEQLLTELENK